MSFVGVNIESWMKNPDSINNLCSSLCITDDDSFPKAMIKVSILSHNLDKALVENHVIPMKEHSVYQGYFMLCSNVNDFLISYVKNDIKPHFLQQNSGMKPIKIEQICNEVHISVLVVIADKFCNSDYFIEPFYSIEKYGANDVTEE